MQRDTIPLRTRIAGMLEGDGTRIPLAMWWTAVTLTTVGYGDVATVTTPVGQLIAGFVMVIGVGMVVLPAGMLALRVSQELHESKSRLSLKDGETMYCPHGKRKIGSLVLNIPGPHHTRLVLGRVW